MLGHHTLSGDPFPAEHADLTRAPEILAAHRAHIRLRSRWKEAADHSLTHAMTLTERWRRTAPADERIWPARTRRISTTRTRLWYALARQAITYPEPSPSPSSSPTSHDGSTSSSTPAEPTPSTPPSPPSSTGPG
ncbi:hypothetical protein [Streptomyces sp. YIM S03343]